MSTINFVTHAQEWPIKGRFECEFCGKKATTIAVRGTVSEARIHTSTEGIAYCCGNSRCRQDAINCNCNSGKNTPTDQQVEEIRQEQLRLIKKPSGTSRLW